MKSYDFLNAEWRQSRTSLVYTWTLSNVNNIYLKLTKQSTLFSSYENSSLTKK